jgi:hypothetical protein
LPTTTERIGLSALFTGCHPWHYVPIGPRADGRDIEYDLGGNLGQ